MRGAITTYQLVADICRNQKKCDGCCLYEECRYLKPKDVDILGLINKIDSYKNDSLSEKKQ